VGTRSGNIRCVTNTGRLYSHKSLNYQADSELKRTNKSFNNITVSRNFSSFGNTIWRKIKMPEILSNMAKQVLNGQASSDAQQNWKQSPYFHTTNATTNQSSNSTAQNNANINTDTPPEYESPHPPAALRNRQPIYEKIVPILDELVKKQKKLSGSNYAQIRTLEIASGTGAHLEWFDYQVNQPSDYQVKHNPPSGGDGLPIDLSGVNFSWQPSDLDTSRFCAERHPTRDGIEQPWVLNMEDFDEEDTDFSEMSGMNGFVPQKIRERVQGNRKTTDLVYVANLTHISPFSATRGLFRLATRELRDGGVLVVYGPFTVNGNSRRNRTANFIRV
jgi:hypothetical protein